MNNYGFEFAMKNLVSSPFAKMTTQIAQGFDSAEAKNKSFQKGITDTGRLVNSLAAKMRALEVKRTIELDDKKLKKVEQQLDRLKARHSILSKNLGKPVIPNPTDDKTNNAGGMASLASNPYVVAALAGGLAARQVINSASALSDKGYTYERNRFGITQYSGDANVSETYINRLSKTSTGKMFGSDAVSGFQQAMMGFRDTEKSFDFVTKTLSNISAATGNSIAELASIQMKTRMQGYVQMDEAQQWSERKIPLLEYLSKATGLNSSKLLKAIEDRKVKTESFDKALTMMTSGKGIFANMTEKASQTGFGQKSAFENTLDLKLQQAGNRFNEMFANRFYVAANSFIAALEKKEPELSNAFSHLANRLMVIDQPINKLRDGMSASEKAAHLFAGTLTGLANLGTLTAGAIDSLDRYVAKSHLNKDFASETTQLQMKQLKDNFGMGRFPLFRTGKEAENLRSLHNRENQDLANNQQKRMLGLEQGFGERDKMLRQSERATKFGDRANERRNIRKGLNPDGTKKDTNTNNSTNTSTGKGLESTATGGSVKNITINVSSLINQMQIMREQNGQLDTNTVRRLLHEELTATIASAMMMGTGN